MAAPYCSSKDHQRGLDKPAWVPPLPVMNPQCLAITPGNDPVHSTGPAGPGPCPSLRLRSFLPLVTDPFFWFSKIPSPLHPWGLCNSYYSAVKSLPGSPLRENFLSLREPHFLSELPSGLRQLWRCVFRPSHPRLSSASPLVICLPTPAPNQACFYYLGCNCVFRGDYRPGWVGVGGGSDGFGLAE